jgi:hypothetical protein
MLRMLLTEHATVPWQALVYLTAEITYGGRVTDMWDKRCLVNIVEKFCSSDCLEEGFSYTSSKVSLNKPYHSMIPYHIIPWLSSSPYHTIFHTIYHHTMDFGMLMSTLPYIPKSSNMLMSILMGMLDFGIYMRVLMRYRILVCS